jgi:hypothetical protein
MLLGLSKEVGHIALFYLFQTYPHYTRSSLPYLNMSISWWINILHKLDMSFVSLCRGG